MKQQKPNSVIIDDIEISISGRLLKMAQVQGEYYVSIGEPKCFLQKLKSLDTGAGMFTFLQQIGDQTAKYSYYQELESLAVLPVSTYENWWKRQINDKTRNMIRKASKGGLELRLCEFNDIFARGIMDIYNECPIRQGKPFKHYGNDLPTISSTHSTFLHRSEFVGAFHGDEMIGFLKLVHGRTASSLMQIISKVAWRDKAPTNALIGKAVELCAEKKVPYLHYGIWSRRGLGDFKKHHGFLQHDIPRYYVPLNLAGRLILKLSLHRKLASYIPEAAQDKLVALRSQWNQFRHKS